MPPVTKHTSGKSLSCLTSSVKRRGRPRKCKAETTRKYLANKSNAKGSRRFTIKDVENEIKNNCLAKVDKKQISKILGLQPILERLALPKETKDWTETETSNLVEAIAGPKAGAACRKAHLRGSQLLLTSQKELVTLLQLKLGPALKLCAAVLELRQHTISKCSDLGSNIICK